MNKQGSFLGVPYDWRRLTFQRLKSRFWNKDDHRLFTPKSLGWGYDVNLYELIHHRKHIFYLAIILLIILIGFGVQHAIYVDNAHKTFEKYYAFRGCKQLITRTDTYGICKTDQNQVIKIVKFNNEWYLDDDLPTCIGKLCF